MSWFTLCVVYCIVLVKHYNKQIKSEILGTCTYTPIRYLYVIAASFCFVFFFLSFHFYNNSEDFFVNMV